MSSLQNSKVPAKKNALTSPFNPGEPSNLTNSSNGSKASSVKSKLGFQGNQGQFIPVLMNGPPASSPGNSNGSQFHQYQPNINQFQPSGHQNQNGEVKPLCYIGHFNLSGNEQPMMYTMAYIPVSSQFNYQGPLTGPNTFIMSNNSNSGFSKASYPFPAYQPPSQQPEIKVQTNIHKGDGDQSKPRSLSNNYGEGYKPYTLKDYKNKLVNENFKYGGLGANINTEEWFEKKNKISKINKYSENIKEANSQKTGANPNYFQKNPSSYVDYQEELSHKNPKKSKVETGHSTASTAEDLQINKVQEELMSLEKRHAYLAKKLKNS